MRIEEGRDLVPVSDANLLRVIPFFLQGIALSWFRGSKHLWRTFEQFARAFRVRFGDSDFQFELRQEIHLRTQGVRESVSDYLTCMRAMFDKLKPRMSESEEVSYANRNLLPGLHLAIHRNDKGLCPPRKFGQCRSKELSCGPKLQTSSCPGTLIPT